VRASAWDGTPAATSTAGCTQLAPSSELHAAAYGKSGAPLPFDEYEHRFRKEMEPRQRFWIGGFAERVKRGETITLLCSSACTDPVRCHRTLVKAMIEAAAFPPPPAPAAPGIVRRRRA
jgi:uncharacterized protein YeaO (DUF488 family)